MGNDAFWLTPLILLPGVGMLIVSTSSRLNELHQEIHQLLHDQSGGAAACAVHVVDRSLKFRNALVSFYFSVGCFSLGSLLGSLTIWWKDISIFIVMALSILGIASIVYGALLMIWDSINCTKIIQVHAGEIENKTD